MKLIRLWLALLLVLGLAACSTLGTPHTQTKTPQVTIDPSRSFVEGQLIVGYRQGVDPAKLAAQLGATVQTDWPQLHAALLDLPTGLAVAKAEATAQRLRGLRYAEPNRVVWNEPVSAQLEPASLEAAGLEALGLEPAQLGITLDPEFDKQWMHRQLKTQAAWALGATGKNIRIGIHDEFVDHRHPDLVDNVFYPGYDGFNKTLIEPTTPHDGVGTHGTAVAGTAAAVGGNGIGGLGTAYAADIVPLVINDPVSGGLLTNAIVNSAIFAVLGPDGKPGGDDRAPGTDPMSGPYVHIVNMSWGGDYYDQITKDAMDYMLESGIVLVTSAGNTPTTGFSEPSWLPGLISVAATTPRGIRTDFSNRGRHIDVAAPGENIWTTYTRNCVLDTPDFSSCDPANPEVTYTFISGTSFSSPATAGVAALLLDASADRAADGTITKINLGAAQVRRILETTTQQGGKYDEDLGFGIVDAEAAVKMAQDKSQTPPAGSTLVVNARLKSDENVAVPTVGLTLVPVTVVADAPTEYAQTSNGLLGVPEGTGLFQQVDSGTYQLLASGPHTATTGIPAVTSQMDVTLAPGATQTVTLSLDVKTFVDPFEPNNTVAAATPVQVGTTSRASLYKKGAATDIDLYALNVVAGKTYRANTETVAGAFDTFLKVYAADGTTVLAQNDDNQDFSTDSLVDFTAPSTGTVYVEVSEVSGSNSPFNLYELDIATVIGNETEPNGSATVSGTTISDVDFTAAQKIALGSALNAAIGPTATDTDIFAVDLTAGTTVVADVETTASGAPDTIMGLYDAAGTLVAFNDDYTGRESRVSYTAAQSGTFYVVVASWNAPNPDDGTTGPYGFIVTKHNNPPTE